MPIDTVERIISLRAPQFSGDSRIPDLIALAEQQTSTESFGDNYNLAVALRVMHILSHEVAQGGDASSSGSARSGVVTSEREGDLSRSYQVSTTALTIDFDLATTSFGMELLSLIRGSILGARNRMM